MSLCAPLHSIMRQMRRFLAFAFGVLTLVALTAVGAEGRVVGILFDDSGSMHDRLHLPAYGVQLLVSSLDGVVGKDRLYTIRMSHFEREVAGKTSSFARIVGAQRTFSPGYIQSLLRTATPGLPKEESIQTSQEQQGTIDMVRQKWPDHYHSTPYEPLEILLEQITSVAKPDEELFLIVLTDGEFDRERVPGPKDSYPPESYLRQVYLAYEARVPGRLRVEFLLITPHDDPVGKKYLQDKVAAQKVRDTLLTVFNKSIADPSHRTAADGSHDVSSVDELIAGIRTIVARVSATDSSESRELAIEGEKIRGIRSPFSISRLISIASGGAKVGAPTIVDTSFKRAPDMQFVSGMEKGDTAKGYENEPQAAITSHYRFDPPLPHGELTLQFNRKIEGNVLLLFQTDARYELRVRDGSGNLVAPNSDGSIDLIEKRSYSVEGGLVDRDPPGSGSRVVPFSTLPASAIFKAFFAAREARRTAIALARDDLQNRAVGSMTLPAPSDYRLTGDFVLPGFVAKPAAALQLHVQSAAVGYAAEIRRLADCVDCASDELRITRRELKAGKPIGVVHIEQSQGIPSIARVTMRAPPTLVLADENGKLIGQSFDLNLAPGRAVDLQLRIAEGFAPQAGKTTHEVAVSLTALEPLFGKAATSSRLTVDIPEVKLFYAGNSQSSPLDQPITMSGESLGKAADFLTFRAENLPDGTPPEDIRVLGASWLMEIARRDGTNSIDLIPRQRWCTCLTWIFGVPGTIGIEYAGRAGQQPVSASAGLAFAPSVDELFKSCGAMLLTLLALLWLAGAIYLYLTAFRFPRGSHLEISRANSPVPEHEPLRGSKYRLLIAALLLRRTHERTSVRGLNLEARPSGAVLRYRDSDPDVRLIDQASSIRDVLRENPKLPDQFFPWGSRFSRSRTEKLMIIRGA
jgi:hypothetical protein